MAGDRYPSSKNWGDVCDGLRLRLVSSLRDAERERLIGDGDSCLDFREDPNAQAEELWEPEGASYYNGELMGATRAEADATATARIARYPSDVYWQVSSVRI